MKTILTPIDFSEVSDTVVTASVALAKDIQAKIVLLTVVQPPVFTAEYSALMDNIVEITAIGERTATRQLTAVQERLEKEGLTVETVQYSGAPVVHIAEQAEKSGADYIVMGSHGHTAFYDLLVGSTTHGVLKRARCPVVIVPPKEQLRKKSRSAERH